MSDFVGCPVANRKRGRAKFLVMWTATILEDGKVSSNKKLKFAGGMTKYNDEDWRITYARELKEETGLLVKDDSAIQSLTVVHQPNHEKRFGLIWRKDCVGNLRTGPIPDDDTLLGRPFFAGKKFLERYLHGDHREVLPYLPD